MNCCRLDPWCDSGIYSGIFCNDTGSGNDHICCFFDGDRYFLRLLSGRESSKAGSDRSTALRIREEKRCRALYHIFISKMRGWGIYSGLLHYANCHIEPI